MHGGVISKQDEDSLEKERPKSCILAWFGKKCLVVWCKFGASAMSVLRSIYLTDLLELHQLSCLVEKCSKNLDSPSECVHKAVPSDFDFCRQFPNHDEFSGRIA